MSSETSEVDLAIIGGGIVGLATSMALAGCVRSLVVLEAEQHLATHQTRHSSGVIHSGLYYKPGSLKARLCVEGRKALYTFCERYGVPYDRCGKVVVATDHAEQKRLERLADRGRENGMTDLRLLNRSELRRYEPHASGVAALCVPDTGIVDFLSVAGAMADRVREAGHDIVIDARVLHVRHETSALELMTTRGPVRARFLINCAGLESDRVAVMCGVNPRLRIIPFRGEYYELEPGRRSLVRNLIYPVPDPSLPFLGVHLTRTIDGRVLAGPNAVLAFARAGYSKWNVSLGDMFGVGLYPGFWRMAHRNWRAGINEFHRSFSKSAFVKAIQILVPDIRRQDLRSGGSGVRAQAVDPAGRLLDDFRILTTDRTIHVLNAPSPAATASIAIGEHIASLATGQFNLGSS